MYRETDIGQRVDMGGVSCSKSVKHLSIGSDRLVNIPSSDSVILVSVDHTYCELFKNVRVVIQNIERERDIGPETGLLFLKTAFV